MMFTNLLTLKVISLVTVTTAISDTLWHLVYPPIGKNRVNPANKKLYHVLWGYNSLHLGAIYQTTMLWILNPVTRPYLVWASKIVQTLIVMMIVHQLLVLALRWMLIELKYAKPLPENYLHNVWTFYGYNLHLNKYGVLAFNLIAVCLYLLLEGFTK